MALSYLLVWVHKLATEDLYGKSRCTMQVVHALLKVALSANTGMCQCPLALTGMVEQWS